MVVLFAILRYAFFDKALIVFITIESKYVHEKVLTRTYRKYALQAIFTPAVKITLSYSSKR
jgi:hypothetical protein